METKTYHPVDHGWSWFVCLGTGVQAFFVIGGLKSMGVLFMTLVEMFDAPPSLAALTMGLVAGGFALFAILSNAFAVVIGYRKVSLGGAILCCLSALLSVWAVNIYYIIITLGLLSGLAYGAMATPSVVLLNLYFDKRKSLANGLAMVGSSIGQLCLPYLMTFFIDEFGYQGAMLLYSGLCMQAIPAALLMRPLDFWIPKSRKQRDADQHKGQLRDRQEVKDLDKPNASHYAKNKAAEANQFVHASQTSLHRSRTSLQRSRTSLQKSRTSLYGSHRSLGANSTLANSTGSVMLGLSIEDLAEEEVKKKKSSRFCQVLFDRDLLASITFWMLFWSLGIGHAGFIDACLYLPSLGYELFRSKYKGALLIAIMGLCDIGGRIGGGLFADLGLIRRTHLTGIAMLVTGLATFLSMFYPVFSLLIVYSVIMGLFGGIYRILMPVLVRDLFGVQKLSAGVGLCYLSLGSLILPMPTILGYIRQVYHSYVPPMMLCGLLLVVGSILMFLIPFYQRCDLKRSKQFVVDLKEDETKDPENVSLSMTAEDRDNNVNNEHEEHDSQRKITKKDRKC